MILRNNTILQNRYLLLRLLGQGGFGAVYEARDQRLGHRVALKQLTLSGQAVQKAFEREARILARLKHAALPKVSDYFADANSYFLVMEFIPGDDLAAMLVQQRDPFPVEEVLGWADQVLDALEYLHSQQPPVIHRDIKPANIKISPAGKLYLLDFGISKGGRTHTHQAMSGASIQAFSEHYASIEQIEGHGTDGRSDLYSLAVTWHHLLTKQEPPRTVSRARAKLMNKADPLRPVNELNPLVPLGVAQVLTSALNFDPALRPDSARTMRQMLQDAIRPRQRGQPSRIKPTPQPRRTTKRVTQPAPWTQWQPWVIAVGGIIVLILGIFLGTMLINPEPESATIPPPTAIASSDTPEAAAVAPTEAPIATSEPTVTLIPPTIEPTNPPPTIEPTNPPPTIEPTNPPPTNPPPTIEPTNPPPTIEPTNPPSNQPTISEKDGMTLLSVPEGDFEMGSADNDPDAYDDEKPRHTVYLDAYRIDQTEVTNAMFASFLNEMGNQEEGDVTWLAEESWALIEKVNGTYQPKDRFADHPVVAVSWYGANAYCQWAGRRLPTEAEWEKAAGGTDGRKWPWGNEPPDESLANVSSYVGSTTPVGNYPAGASEGSVSFASPYGALDMAGNVWEWVNDNYDSEYYENSPNENPLGPKPFGTKVLRGGSWAYSVPDARARFRFRSVADYRGEGGGFRCAHSPSLVP